MKPRLLDLYAGAGGAARGYQEAGFWVLGVDINPQPRYAGDNFMQMDALDYLRGADLGLFSGVHSSPPCQAYSKTQQIGASDHPELIGPTRELLRATGLPYVIENVKGAPLIDPQLLEGQMFGLNTHRPRYFETNWGYQAPVLRPPPPPQAKMGRKPKQGEAIQVVGNFTDVEAGREAMGIDWMTRDELAQAIPPAFTKHVGEILLSLLAHTATEAA